LLAATTIQIASSQSHDPAHSDCHRKKGFVAIPAATSFTAARLHTNALMDHEAIIFP